MTEYDSLWERSTPPFVNFLDMLPSQFVERLKSMAKFRNLLVHLYWKVDDNKVFQILNEDIQDIQEFIKKIDSILSSGS